MTIYNQDEQLITLNGSSLQKSSLHLVMVRLKSKWSAKEVKSNDQILLSHLTHDYREIFAVVRSIIALSVREQQQQIYLKKIKFTNAHISRGQCRCIAGSNFLIIPQFSTCVVCPPRGVRCADKRGAKVVIFFFQVSHISYQN